MLNRPIRLNVIVSFLFLLSRFACAGGFQFTLEERYQEWWNVSKEIMKLNMGLLRVLL